MPRRRARYWIRMTPLNHPFAFVMGASIAKSRSDERIGRADGVLYRAQACSIGYFAKISWIRLNAFSAAACGAIPSFMMSTQPIAQTCSFWTWA